jgi:hypothetical protein
MTLRWATVIVCLLDAGIWAVPDYSRPRPSIDCLQPGVALILALAFPVAFAGLFTAAIIAFA